MCHMLCVKCQVSCFTGCVSHVTCHLLPVTCHLSPVTNANSQAQPHTLPLQTSPLCTLDWFAKTQKI